MIRYVVGSLLALIELPCDAGVLHCSFTEPFFTLSYDSATGRVVRISPDEVDDSGRPIAKVIARNATVKRDSGHADSSDFALMSGSQILLKLHLDGNGSDGMSEAVFPFRAEYDGQEGGCDTAKYPRWDFDDLAEDLRTRR